jgi:hypothetical protein
LLTFSALTKRMASSGHTAAYLNVRKIMGLPEFKMEDLASVAWEELTEDELAEFGYPRFKGLERHPSVQEEAIKSLIDTYYIVTRLNASGEVPGSLDCYRLAVREIKKWNHLYPSHPLLVPTLGEYREVTMDRGVREYMELAVQLRGYRPQPVGWLWTYQLPEIWLDSFAERHKAMRQTVITDFVAKATAEMPRETPTTTKTVLLEDLAYAEASKAEDARLAAMDPKDRARNRKCEQELRDPVHWSTDCYGQPSRIPDYEIAKAEFAARWPKSTPPTCIPKDIAPMPRVVPSKRL